MAQVLQPLTIATHPDILVGLQTSDDAAVLRITDELAIVQTVDFFAPVVDDPYEFGAIAAANSMSDVFAMGGEVTMGLNIAAFPGDLDIAILSEIFRGGSDKMQEAGGVIAGGHTVTDNEPKYGVSVTGRIHPDRIWTKSGAQTGDILFLTKPLGSGVLTTAAKQQKIGRALLQPAVDQMMLLNMQARDIAVKHQVNAATDITGFGLIGHGYEMSVRSNAALHIDVNALPIFPSVLELIQTSVVAGGLHRNRDHFTAIPEAIHLQAGIPFERILLGFDPQTSGGLLFSISADSAAAFAEDFRTQGHSLWEVGSVREGIGVHLLGGRVV